MEEFHQTPQETSGDDQFKKETLRLLRNHVTEMGFIETADMKTIREKILQEYKTQNMEAIKPLFITWTEAAQELVTAISEQDPYMKAHIGLLVATATIYLELDMKEDAGDELYSAAEYARQYHLDELHENMHDYADVLSGNA